VGMKNIKIKRSKNKTIIKNKNEEPDKNRQRSKREKINKYF